MLRIDIHSCRTSKIHLWPQWLCFQQILKCCHHYLSDPTSWCKWSYCEVRWPAQNGVKCCKYHTPLPHSCCVALTTLYEWVLFWFFSNSAIVEGLLDTLFTLRWKRVLLQKTPKTRYLTMFKWSCNIPKCTRSFRNWLHRVAQAMMMLCAQKKWFWRTNQKIRGVWVPWPCRPLRFPIFTKSQLVLPLRSPFRHRKVCH